MVRIDYYRQLNAYYESIISGQFPQIGTIDQAVYLAILHHCNRVSQYVNTPISYNTISTYSRVRDRRTVRKSLKSIKENGLAQFTLEAGKTPKFTIVPLYDKEQMPIRNGQTETPKMQMDDVALEAIKAKERFMKQMGISQD